MRAVVTGATGLVGFHVSSELLKQGYRVMALGRNADILEELEGLGAEAFHLDIRADLKEWPTFDQGAVWVHCAAAVSGASSDILWDVNVEGTRKVIETAIEEKGKRFIHTSSIATYDMEIGRAFREGDPLRPGSEYGRTKLEADRLVTSMLKGVIPYTIFKPPFIIGPRDRNFTYEVYRRLENGKLPLLTRDGRIGLIDARDLAETYVQAVEIKDMFDQTYNIQSFAVSFHEFVQTLCRISGLEPPKRKTPYPLAYIAAIGVEFVNKLRGRNSERGLSRYRIKTLTQDRILDTEKLRTVMEFHPRPWTRSLEDWFSEFSGK